jgi:octaheme c-type cytochrome (tetrathionate reductase family)
MKTLKVRSSFRFGLPLIVATLAVSWLAFPAGTLAVPEDHAYIEDYTDSTACMECHEDTQHNDLMASSHWTWNHVDADSGQVLGKKNVINNFCVATASNEPRCTMCHVGIGWRDDSFDFTDKSAVDCLVCHDTTGTYSKAPKGAGAPTDGLDLVGIAMSAGLTSRQTCGACHFNGGGGDAVKHGDLDTTMANPTREMDVHMGTDGGDFTCARCHSDTDTSSNHHDFIGTRYPTTSPDHELCQKCHTATPHDNARLNTHTAKVSCQACHIPAYARGGKTTKETWDWSTAGDRNPDNSQKKIFDSDGNTIYDSMKGTFSWKEKVVPDYRWFNGSVTYATLDTPITNGQVIAINQLHGDKDDSTARLFPVKHFTGSQPYDEGTGKLAVPHLFPSSPTDTDAYWKGYNWTNALIAGQAAVGRTFVGPMGIVDTEMFWIQNHMVAPKENALGCADCHSPGARVDFAALGYAAEDAARLQSFFPVEAIALEAADSVSGISLEWTAGVNYFRYQVQSSTNLVDWTNEADGHFVGESAGQNFNFTKPMDEDGPAHKFYRVMRSTQ